MSVRMQIWRAGDALEELPSSGTPTKKRLEELLETNPILLGPRPTQPTRRGSVTPR